MSDTPPPTPTIYILTGGSGASGEQVVHSVLAHFPSARVQVVTLAGLRLAEQVDAALDRAQNASATVVHTLVDPALRRYTVEAAERRGVAAIDLMGSLFDRLEAVLGERPLGQPGLYRKLNKVYFDRIAAIDYTMAHDDGKAPEGFTQAEIVLLGVSRVGKTPLSMYLAVMGWKTANLPIVIDLPLPPVVKEIDPGRAFGLTIDPAELMELRLQRQRRMGVPVVSDYVDPHKIFEEIEYAEALFKRHGFTTLDVTDRPIETNADEIIRLISQRHPARDQVG